jgi:hypothetical protein
VSDDILERAGISREDFDSMKAQAKSVGGGSTRPGPGDQNGEEETNDSNFLANFASLENGVYKGTAPSTGNVKTNNVVYIPEQDKYSSVEGKTSNRSANDKKQTTWKRSTTK